MSRSGRQVMAALKAILRPGDVLAVRGHSWEAEAIRLGEELSGKPGLDNHIAIMHHWDGDVPWGLEGKPGGVGWADLRAYTADPYTVNNCRQPGRTEPMRALVTTYAEKMLGTGYDWEAIADDALRAFRMADLFSKTVNGTVPGHVVCSSYAAFLYKVYGWDHPNIPDRDCEPADWTEFIVTHGWNTELR